MDAKEDVAPWIERFARVGYVAKAVLYATVGLLAMGAVFGNGRSTDARGAMLELLEKPFGRLLLIVITLGLVGYATWRCVSAVIDAERRGGDAKGLALRASFLARGLAHFVLAWSAGRLAFGDLSAGSADNAEQATSAAMRMPGGTLLVGAVALGIAGFGAYQLWRAATAKLSKQLRRGKMQAEVGRWVVVVSRIGIAARGLVFIAIGWLLGRAAVTNDPQRAGGIGDAMRSLEQLGRWPYAAIGAGLIAYGVYELLNARYRRIEATD
ncbi:MAG TPA: DUF1206 domain-containing protein [Gemmatimonadaceae bacterium]|nr:DUF1206 domain-containing protein [Gemmatimonadaceae bacterium]